ncbi:MAG: YabP/YqfC family sporulation protein [Clostridia bacterium]|nr:YabP/YqfC family sporulation protein [Clostridia bacterium]
MEKKEEQKPHAISIDNRNKCVMSGILKVVSATDTCINLQTSLGALTINGSSLKLVAFSESNGSLSMQGEINAIKYGAKTSAIKKLFG